MASSKDKYTQDSHDETRGFGEAPQSGFSGAPLSGSISDWAKEIGDEAEKPQPKAKSPKAAKTPKKVPERSKEATPWAARPPLRNAQPLVLILWLVLI
jgi:excinuclease ABC subunit B